jgi:hypothetical protein
MDQTLLQLLTLTFVIHVIDTLAYSVRINSVKSGQYALSISLFNLFYLVSLTAHSLQTPLIGSFVDSAFVSNLDPLPVMRRVISVSTLGTFVGIGLTPTFLKLFAVAIGILEKTGSVPSVAIEALHLRNIKKFLNIITKPSRKMVNKLPLKEIPKGLLLLNALITGLYTVGVISAFYATSLVANEHRLAASASSGVINCLANIIFMLFVDPKSAIITDQAFRGNRPYGDVKALVVLLMSSKLIGTLLGQVLLIPLAKSIATFF